MDLQSFLAQWHDSSPTLLVHTSGSTGRPKPMLVEKRRMQASARITCRFLGLHEGDSALLCMPLDYIAGKMMVVRALTCGLRLVSVEPKGTPEWDGAIDLAAMVPLQVYNLLNDPSGRQRLRQVRHLIIGGGAVHDDMARQLASFPNHVWSTYGMTETLSHIALRPLNGPDASPWYTPFQGVTLTQDADGCLVIDAPAVHDGPLQTNDIAELRPDGRFRILGRRDNVCCSGGIKIQIEQVEQLLQPHLAQPFLVSKTPDDRLGEQLVLLTQDADLDAVRRICRDVLPRYWQPRRYLHVDAIPLTDTGKPARAQAAALFL